MSTKDTVQSFYDKLKDKKDWDTFFSDDMVFITNGKPIPGKSTSLDGIRRFYSTVQSFEVNSLLIDGEKASAIVRYALQSPKGHIFNSDVAEFFGLKDGKFVSSAIYFDTAPYA